MSAPRDADLSAIEEIRSRTGIGPTVRATVKAANVDELAALIEQTDSDRVDLLEIVDRLLSAPAPRETALRDQLLAMSDVDFEAFLEQRGIAGRVREAEREAADSKDLRAVAMLGDAAWIVYERGRRDGETAAAPALDVAWRAVEETLPDGWWRISLTHGGALRQSIASIEDGSEGPMALSSGLAVGIGSTPTVALTRLAERLRAARLSGESQRG